MFYVKNLPTWERAVRLVGATAMALCSWQFSPTPLGVVFGISAAITAATAVFGFCPMCSIAGRRLGPAQD